MIDEGQDPQDPLGILGPPRRPATPSAAPADATRVGPGPANPGARELTGMARVASDVFEHGIPYTPIPGAADFEKPATGLVPKMVEQAAFSAAGPYVAKGARRVLALVKKTPVRRVADVVLSMPGVPGNTSARMRLGRGLLEDAARSARPKGPPVPGLQEPMESVAEAAQGGALPFSRRTPSVSHAGPAAENAGVEGLQGAMESASEAQGPTGVIGTLKRQRGSPSSVADVVKGTAKGTTGEQAHRTQAQFDHVAELMRARKAAQAARDPRQSMFDAFSKEAQTLDDGRALPELDLEDLLRRSLRPARP